MECRGLLASQAINLKSFVNENVELISCNFTRAAIVLKVALSYFYSQVFVNLLHT